MAAACAAMENEEAALFEETAIHLQKWLQEWTQMGWLTEEHTDLLA